MNANFLNLSPEELTALLAEMGEPAYRAGQIFSWMHRGVPLSGMTDLPKKLRAALAEKGEVFFPGIVRKLVSEIDGTAKYLFSLADGEMIESVVMRYKYGNSICISSQVGCRMGCRFCASTLGGKVRDLTPGEMLGQIIAAEKDLGERISHVVMMGIGEPMDNYDNVVKFLRLVNHEKGLNISYRSISVSTCGVAEKIRLLAGEDFPITLSISLHASDDETRSGIMPVNNKYPLGVLMPACREYFDKTGRRISFEYTLIAGKNDGTEQAVRLAELLHRHFGRNCPVHVNLIPLNEVKERGLKTSTPKSVRAFQEKLEELGINATVRRTLGPDIQASCGQLRRGEINKEASAPETREAEAGNTTD